jgi:hypothetical protein
MLAADDRDGVLDSDLDSREASSSSVGFLLWMDWYLVRENLPENESKSLVDALGACYSGHRLLHRILSSWVRISRGCKVFSTLYILFLET